MEVNSNNENKLVVDYTKTIDEVILESGYCWVDDDITSKNFPIPPETFKNKTEISTRLLCFHQNFKLKNVVSEIDKAGYRPATLMELLTFGILFPDLIKRFTIIAIGSFWDDGIIGRWFAFLQTNKSGSFVNLGLFQDGFDAYCHFLVVRK